MTAVLRRPAAGAIRATDGAIASVRRRAANGLNDVHFKLLVLAARLDAEGNREWMDRTRADASRLRKLAEREPDPQEVVDEWYRSSDS